MDEGPAVAPAELWRGKWKVRRAPGSQQDKAQITNPLHASKIRIPVYGMKQLKPTFCGKKCAECELVYP